MSPRKQSSIRGCPSHLDISTSEQLSGAECKAQHFLEAGPGWPQLPQLAPSWHYGGPRREMLCQPRGATRRAGAAPPSGADLSQPGKRCPHLVTDHAGRGRDSALPSCSRFWGTLMAPALLSPIHSPPSSHKELKHESGPALPGSKPPRVLRLEPTPLAPKPTPAPPGRPSPLSPLLVLYSLAAQVLQVTAPSMALSPLIAGTAVTTF